MTDNGGLPPPPPPSGADSNDRAQKERDKWYKHQDHSLFLSNTHIQSLSLSFFQTPKKFTKIYLTSFILLSFSFLIPIPIKRCEYKFEMRKGSRNVSFRKIGREREIANMCVLMRYELGCISKKYFWILSTQKILFQ